LKRNRKTIDELLKSLNSGENIIEGRGFYVIESDRFKALNYAYKENTLAIITKKNGMLSIGIDALDDLITELSEISGHLKDRKEMRISGA